MRFSHSPNLDFEIYTDKIGQSARPIVRRAYEQARDRDHNLLTPEHVFIAIAEIELPLFNAVMRALNLDAQIVLQALETRLSQHDYSGHGMKIAESLRILLLNALKHARSRGCRLIESADLFAALFEDGKSYPAELLKQLGAIPQMIIKEIDDQARR